MAGFLRLGSGIFVRPGVGASDRNAIVNALTKPPPEPFKYDRNLVRGNEIRILHLKAGNATDKLDCTIKYCRLDGQSTFQALSYTWGSPFIQTSNSQAYQEPDRSHYLWIDGKPLQITESLDSALRHLRFPQEELCIWVDAVCIDQNHNEEKSCQVKQFRKIYEQASSVIVWLGPSAQGSDKAMDTLQSMRNFAVRSASYIQPGTSTVSIPPPTTVQEYEDQLVAASFGRLFEKEIQTNVRIPPYPLEEVTALLNRAWWGRGWVLQELAVAKNVTFACGFKRMEQDGDMCFETFTKSWDVQTSEFGRPPNMVDHRPWTMLTIRSARVLMTGLTESFSGHLPSTPAIRRSEIEDIDPRFSDDDEAATFQWAKEQLSLKELLRESSLACLGTKLPQDRIFSLLGLATDGKELGIDINYDHPYEAVFIRVAVAYLERNDLWFLSYCIVDPDKLFHKIPSWVPDWSFEHGRQTLLPSESKRRFNASNGRAVSFAVKTPPGAYFHHELTLKGIIVDKIDWWSERLTVSQNNLHPTTKAEIVQWMADIVLPLSTQGQKRACTTLVAGMDPLPIKYSEWDPEERIALVEEAFTSLLQGQPVADPGIRQRADCFFHQMMNATNGRRVFRTESGYIGLSSSFVRKDDKVVIFHGGTVPFVVRPVELKWGTSVFRLNKYKIVGEAYVHDIMEGEIFKEEPAVVDILLA
jgi:hypothetical protein